MFAVPGWSVSSSALKTQTSEPSKSQPPAPTSLGSENTSKTSKKRKRSSGKSKSSEVNSANLSDLWEAVIEKKNKPKNPSREKKHPSKKPRIAGKLEDGNSNGLDDTFSGDSGHTKLEEKPRRHRDGKRVKEVGLVRSEDADVAHNDTKRSEVPPAMDPIASLTPLQFSMRQKLISARFRHLNETLYTTPSTHSLAIFRQNPEMFQEYHEGFRRQVEVWPENPLDIYLAQIKRRGIERGVARRKSKAPTVVEAGYQESQILPLPRTEGICHIADLGCGDASLSQGLEVVKKKLKIQVYSYDLQSPNPLVTQADIADLPLKDASIDVAIFCLALMGTNWIDFIEEAFRILRWKGELWIAEIKSRFGRVRDKARRVQHSVGNRKRSEEITARTLQKGADDTDLLVEVDGQEGNKRETDVSAFVEVLRKRGFVLQNETAVDMSNKMFVRMGFLKGHTPVKGKCIPVPKGTIETGKKKPKGRFLNVEEEIPVSSEATVLKPCVYKLR
jgi:ribosomal RNA-processing protein 8